LCSVRTHSSSIPPASDGSSCHRYHAQCKLLLFQPTHTEKIASVRANLWRLFFFHSCFDPVSHEALLCAHSLVSALSNASAPSHISWLSCSHQIHRALFSRHQIPPWEEAVCKEPDTSGRRGSCTSHQRVHLGKYHLHFIDIDHTCLRQPLVCIPPSFLRLCHLSPSS
jgi:hypothetical protein